MPLFLRLSATEWMGDTDLGRELGSWTVSDTIAITKIAADLCVDLLDVSSGGNHPQQRINMFESKDYQTRIASQIRQELKLAGKTMLIGAVGLITEAEQARDIVATDGSTRQPDTTSTIDSEAQEAVQLIDSRGGQDPSADVVLVARQFMREPEWVLKVAWRLGLDIAWPAQFNRVRFPKL